MNKIRLRWRLYTNFFLLSTVLITSFQNCSHVHSLNGLHKSDLHTVGIEITTEQ